MIVYEVWSGKVFGGSNPRRTVKQVQKDSIRHFTGGDVTMELDLSNRSFIMEADNKKIVVDCNIGDFDYSPIVIFADYGEPEVTLL